LAVHDTNKYRRSHTHTGTNIDTQSHINTLADTNTHICIDPHTDKKIQTHYTQTHTNTHPHSHTYPHKHTHTHTQ